MARKKWSELADSTKRRYRKAGISPQQYNAGHVTPERKQEIYGKRKTSWQIEIAKQKGLESGLSVFSQLSLKQKAILADLYLKGVVARRQPFDSEGNLRKGNELDLREFIWSKRDNRYIPNPRYGKPLKTVEQISNEVKFTKIINEMDWEDFEWNDDVREQLEASSSAMQSTGN